MPLFTSLRICRVAQSGLPLDFTTRFRRCFTSHIWENRCACAFRHQEAILHFVLRAHRATTFAVLLNTTTSSEIESVVSEIDFFVSSTFFFVFSTAFALDTKRMRTDTVDKDPPQARSVSGLPEALFKPMTPRACACHVRPDVPPSS